MRPALILVTSDTSPPYFSQLEPRRCRCPWGVPKKVSVAPHDFFGQKVPRGAVYTVQLNLYADFYVNVSINCKILMGCEIRVPHTYGAGWFRTANVHARAVVHRVVHTRRI